MTENNNNESNETPVNNSIDNTNSEPNITPPVNDTVNAEPTVTSVENMKTNTLAIVSFVSSFFISLVAVITGHIAVSQIKKTKEKGKGFAIAGLVIGYVGIFFTILAVIGGIMLASFLSTVNPTQILTDNVTSQIDENWSPNIQEDINSNGEDFTGNECDVLVSSIQQYMNGNVSETEIVDILMSLYEETKGTAFGESLGQALQTGDTSQLLEYCQSAAI